MANKIFSKNYFSERPLMILSGTVLLMMLTIVFRVATTVRQYDYKVATGYTQYGADSFELGDWYSLYGFAFFAGITTVTAILISARLVKIDKYLAYMTMALQLVVLIFLFIVSTAILGASSIAA